MPEQLTFDLPLRQAFGRDAFFVAPSNALALRMLEDWPVWPLARSILIGDQGCGKTHLARVWQAETDACYAKAGELAALDISALASHGFLVLEDIDQIVGRAGDENKLFHLINMAQANNTRFLMTSESPPTQLKITLPDLKSRLEATFPVNLDAPDDTLLSAMLIKQFSDRQLDISPRVITYVLGRMERSASSVEILAQALDHAALVQKRPITRQLAGEVLDKL